MAVSQRRPHKTWSLLGDVKRRPSAYEVTAAKFNYHFRREPAPFEMDPQAPFNLFYLKHREGSAFNVPDWEGFRDPAKLTYADYVTLQHERETYVDLLTDHHEAAESVGCARRRLGRDAARAVRPVALPAARAADDRAVRRADGADGVHHQLRELPGGRRAAPDPADRLQHQGARERARRRSRRHRDRPRRMGARRRLAAAARGARAACSPSRTGARRSSS